VSARRAAAALATGLAVAAASPAAAYIRSTTGDPNAANPPADPTVGKCLFWNTRALHFKVNAAGYASAPGCTDATAAAKLARDSVHAWEVSGTDFRFVDDGDIGQTAIGQDTVNLIVFRKGACADPLIVSSTDPCHRTPGACASQFNCWEHDISGANGRTIALTTATYRTDTGEIVDADMELYGVNPGGNVQDGWYFTCPAAGPTCTGIGQNNCISIDVGTTATHEAGHMLGLDHVCSYQNVPASTCDRSAVMFPTAQQGVTRRNLSQDDVNGVVAIYPAGLPVDTKTGCLGNSASGSTQGSSSGGCGTGAGGALALLGLLPLALRRLRSVRPERSEA
jgi:hypothetical protein